MTETIAALVVALSLTTTSADIKSNTGYIFLGDSRTVGMNNAVEFESSNQFVVAKVGEGYKWMVDTGLPEVCDIIENHTQYTDWILISNLGVNDLKNLDNYVDAYEQLSDLMKVYVVSINPCDGPYSNLNDSIDSFNETMSGLDCVTYIDTHEYLVNSGFETVDGLHYKNGTYEKIYTMVSNIVIGEGDDHGRGEREEVLR